jgi:hypothetical protein
VDREERRNRIRQMYQESLSGAYGGRTAGTYSNRASTNRQYR